jgi:hypothetical protein
MLILDATTKSLEIDLAGAVSANELPVTAHYTDITTTLYTPGSNDTQTNGATAVTIVAAPAASTQRHVESISVYNADTAAATVTIQLNNNSTLRIITKVTLQAAEQLFYEDGMGWQIIDANGAVIRGTNVSDVAFGTTWNGVGAIAPSKNSVYNWGIVDHNTDGTHEKLTLGSDADGDMYYRASSALARLAKGTANYKLFMDAGATAPEWAQGIGYKATSYDLSTDSGDQAISGVGFKPSGFIVLATINGSTEWSVGFGVGPLLIEYSINYRSDSGKMLIGAVNLIRIYMSAGSQNAILKSWDSDGVTLTWTKESSPTGTLTQYFIFFR